MYQQRVSQNTNACAASSGTVSQALYDRLVTDLPLPRVSDAYAVADGALDEAVSDDVIAVNFSDQITKVYHGPAQFDLLLQGTGE